MKMDSKNYGLFTLVAVASLSGCAANIEKTPITARDLPEEVEDDGHVRIRYHPNGYVVLVSEGEDKVGFAYNADSKTCILVEGDRNDPRLKIEDDLCDLAVDSLENKSIRMSSFTKEARNNLNSLLLKRKSDLHLAKVSKTWKERWR